MYSFALGYGAIARFFTVKMTQQSVRHTDAKKITNSLLGRVLLVISALVFATTADAGSILPKWLAPTEIFTTSPTELSIHTLTRQPQRAQSANPHRRSINNRWEDPLFDTQREMAALEQRMAAHPLKPTDRTQWLMVFQQRLQDLGMEGDEYVSANTLLNMLNQMNLLSATPQEQKTRQKPNPQWLKAVLPFLKQGIYYGATPTQMGLNYGIEWHTRGLTFHVEYRL